MDIYFGNKRVRLNDFNATMGPTDDKYISLIEREEVDGVVFEVTTSILKIEGMFLTYVNYATICTSSVDSFLGVERSMIHKVVTTAQHSSRNRFSQKFELLPPLAIELESSSFVSLLVVELKPLLHILKYIYLGVGENIIMIVYSELSLIEEEKLIFFLKTHKKVSGWKVADLKGTDPSFYMHHIHTLKDSKSV